MVDLIRGQQAGKAITILRSTNKRIAPTVEKVLRSAIANAENKNNDVDVDRLFVSEAYVNEGPRMKRIRPAPMGRAYRYQRRMSHIVVAGRARRINDGTESTSVRISAGRHQDVAVALVRQAGLREAAAWKNRAEGSLASRLKARASARSKSIVRATSCGSRSAPRGPASSSAARARRSRS